MWSKMLQHTYFIYYYKVLFYSSFCTLAEIVLEYIHNTVHKLQNK